ncbi:MAG: membrane protein insertion efficiency factor YidD [Hyphomicrobiaceae bacterium]
MTALGAWSLKGPIHLYRWTLRPWLGWPCRHLPTCSDYALEAIDKNGPWRGFWLTVSRLSRCRPGGTAGFDPVPDTCNEHHPVMPWRHGRWGKRHMTNTSHHPD